MNIFGFLTGPLVRILRDIEAHLDRNDAHVHALKHQLDRIERRVKRIEDELGPPPPDVTATVTFSDPQPKHLP